jgi:hypothetical protein
MPKSRIASPLGQSAARSRSLADFEHLEGLLAGRKLKTPVHACTEPGMWWPNSTAKGGGSN